MALDPKEKPIVDEIERNLRRNWGKISTQKPANPDEYFATEAEKLFHAPQGAKILTLPDNRQINFSTLSSKMAAIPAAAAAAGGAGALASIHIPTPEEANEIRVTAEKGAKGGTENWLTRIINFIVGALTGFISWCQDSCKGGLAGLFEKGKESIGKAFGDSGIKGADKALDDLAKQKPQLAPLINHQETRRAVHTEIRGEALFQLTGNRPPASAGPDPKTIAPSESVPFNEAVLEKEIRTTIAANLYTKDSEGKSAADQLKENITTQKDGQRDAIKDEQIKELETAIGSKLMQVMKGEHGKRLSESSPAERQQSLKQEMRLIINDVATRQEWQGAGKKAWFGRNLLGADDKAIGVDTVTDDVAKGLNSQMNLLVLADKMLKSGAQNLEAIAAEPSPTQVAQGQADSGMTPASRPRSPGAPLPAPPTPAAAMPPPGAQSPAPRPR